METNKYNFIHKFSDFGGFRIEVEKIVSSIKVPFAISVIVTIIGVLITAMLFPDASLSVFSIVFQVIGFAVIFWAGYTAAKSTNGGITEGAIAGVSIALVNAGIAFFLLSSVVFPPGMAVDSTIIGLSYGIIAGLLLGAVAGWFAGRE